MAGIVQRGEFCFGTLLPIGVRQVMKLIEMDRWKAKLFGERNRKG